MVILLASLYVVFVSNIHACVISSCRIGCHLLDIAVRMYAVAC